MSSSVPVCSGYVPSTSWRKKNKCKVCGQPLSNHNSSAPITITKAIQAPVSIPFQTQPLPVTAGGTSFVPTGAVLQRNASSIVSPGTVRRDLKEKKDDKKDKGKKSIGRSDLTILPQFKNETRLRSGSSAPSISSDLSSGASSPEGSITDGSTSLSRATAHHAVNATTTASTTTSTITSTIVPSSPPIGVPNNNNNNSQSSSTSSSPRRTLEINKSSTAKKVSLSPNPREEIKKKKKDNNNIKDIDIDDDKKSSTGGAMESREQVGDYILIDKLGKGAYGVVYKALHLFEGNTVAIKQLNLKGANRNVVEGLQSEIELLQSLDHENITRYIGHIRKGKELSIVMEYVENGSMATMVKKYGRFPEPLCKAYIKKVLTGLIYLHEQGVIHRDIKPDNILITKDGGVKLADFGVSVKLNSLKGDGEGEDGTPAGTPYYMAPEVIEFRGAVSQSDVWSLGCTIIELLKGEPPYFSHDPFSAMYKMVEDDHPPLPTGISIPLSNFLMSCFHKDVNMRTPARVLLKHAWLDIKKAEPANIAKDVKVLENYNEELEKEIAPAKKNQKQEDQAELMEVMTLTAVMKDRMRENLKQKTNPLSNSGGVSAALSFNKPLTNKNTETKEVKKPQEVKKTTKVTQVKPAPVVEDEEEDWDAEFGGESAPKLSLGLKEETKQEIPRKDSLGFGDIGELNMDLGASVDFGKLDGLDFPDLGKLALKEVQFEDVDELNWDDDIDNSTPMANININKNKNELAAQDYKAEAIKRYKEEQDDDDDFGGDFGDIQSLKSTNLGGKLQKLKAQDEEFDGELVFEEEAFVDEDAIARERAQDELIIRIKEYISVLKPEAPEDKVKQTCAELYTIFMEHAEVKRKLITNHGLLPMIAMLDVDSTVTQNAVLRLIVNIINDKDILVNMCVMGVIPAIINICDPSKPVVTRLYTAYFAQCAISTPETLQMFLACGGLTMLCDFLDGDYISDKDLVTISVGCISRILNPQAQSMTPKNEYLHLFMNINLLRPLAQTLICMVDDDSIVADDDDLSILEKTMLIFKSFSMGDTEIKKGMCSPQVLPRFLEALNKMDHRSKELPLALSVIRNLSGDRFALLTLSIFVEPLCRIGMWFVKQNDFAKDIIHPVTLILYYICRLYNRPHQEAAVRAGLIPFLRFVVERNKPLKEFSVPLLCELSKTSAVTRAALFDSNGLEFYLELLEDRSTRAFHPEAMEAIASCVGLETSKSEKILTEPKSIDILTQVFEGALEHQLPNLVESALQILIASAEIARLLASSEKFIRMMKQSLNHPTPHARVTVLKTLNLMSSKSDAFLRKNKLLKVVRFMAENDASALVRQMAAQLLKESKMSNTE